jgi:hypothetical protein
MLGAQLAIAALTPPLLSPPDLASSAEPYLASVPKFRMPHVCQSDLQVLLASLLPVIGPFMRALPRSIRR